MRRKKTSKTTPASLPIPEIWNIGSTVFIIGGGSSIAYSAGIKDPAKKDIDRVAEFLKPIHNKKVIGVNNAYMLGNWIDVLWFGDCNWFVFHEQNIPKVFTGLKASCCPRFKENPRHGIVFVGRDNEKRQGISTRKNKVAWNKNSGGCAINLAYHFGARKIYLLGFDMHHLKQGITHWFGNHKDGAHNRKNKPFTPPYSRFLAGFPFIKRDAIDLGVEIINVINPEVDSAITQFPKKSIFEVLKDAEKGVV